MEVCEQDPEPGYHGATVTRFADEIAEKEFQAIIREAGLTEEDVNRYMVSTELSAAGQKILAAADPQGQQELNRTDPLLAYCRITMPDCIRNGDMLVTHAADGTEVCIGEDMLPGGPISSREGKRTYAKMVQCLNEFEQETSDQSSRDFAENEQTHDR